MRHLSDNTSSARRRATALALLCLVAHLFFISTAHHHRINRPPAVTTITNDDRDARGSQGAASDSTCLSCSAARAFVSTVPSAALRFALIPATTIGSPRLLLPRLLNPDFVLLPSRAPPGA
jgi:hypothetical protein